MFDTLLARCKIIPWILPTWKLLFTFYPSIFTYLRILNRGNPYCKHKPSKHCDHFMLGGMPPDFKNINVNTK
jgi:hypothetical protein